MVGQTEGVTITSRLHRRARTLAGVALLVIAGCGGSEDFGDWESRFHWGAHVAPRDASTPYDQAVSAVERASGQPMSAGRVYQRWEDAFPSDAAKFLKKNKRLMVVSIKPIRADGTRIPWADIATAPEGGELDAEMTTWAKRLASFGRPVYVVFHHEPETADDQASGRPRDYRAAFTRFAAEMRANGGPNLRVMWIMTDRSFTLPADNRQSAAKWYPGDESVDAIGVDAFNWFTCRGRDEPWTPISELVRPALAFATSHPGKELWIAELGSVDDPARPGRKAEWLAELPTLLADPAWAPLRGVLYFDDVHGAEFPECDWWVDSAADTAPSFGKLAAVPTERAPLTTQGA